MSKENSVYNLMKEHEAGKETIAAIFTKGDGGEHMQCTVHAKGINMLRLITHLVTQLAGDDRAKQAEILAEVTIMLATMDDFRRDDD